MFLPIGSCFLRPTVTKGYNFEENRREKVGRNYTVKKGRERGDVEKQVLFGCRLIGACQVCWRLMM